MPFYAENGFHSGSALALMLTTNVPDANDPAKTVKIGAHETLSEEQIDDMSDEQILRFILHFVEKAELHEVREWFRCNGVPVVDPHPELKLDLRPVDLIPRQAALLSPGEIPPIGY